jgi:hypothetical protein
MMKYLRILIFPLRNKSHVLKNCTIVKTHITREGASMKRIFFAIPLALFLATFSTIIYAATAGQSTVLARNNNNFQKNYNGFMPYPVIDVTNGIPAWVNNYNNNNGNNANNCNNGCTQSMPADKGSYVSSYDNTTQNGKIYYQEYTQGFTGVTISNVGKSQRKNQNQQQNNKNVNETITYGTQK